MNNQLKGQLSLFPAKPGCYLMLNNEGQIIYVGKAKNLKKRLQQYFLPNQLPKTQALVKEIAKIDYLITNTEHEALVLENNLIKKWHPFYNIKLTDDKTYPYIIITNDSHPRLYLGRKLDFNKIKAYYGPFTNVTLARNLVTILNKLYPLRKCYQIPKNKCLYYDLKQCLGPCIGAKEIDYDAYLREINALFSGQQINLLKEKLTTLRYYYKETLNYEEAMKVNDILNNFTFLSTKQLATINDETNADYLGYTYDNDYLSIVILKMRGGSLRDHYQYCAPYQVEPLEAINTIVYHYYLAYPFKAMLYTKTPLMVSIPHTIITKGPKHDLINLALSNASELLKKTIKINTLKLTKTKAGQDALATFFQKSIKVIDALDVAQLFGTSILGGVLRFTDGHHDYQKARFYKLTSEQVDDVNLISELVTKHYQKASLPDLILVDGNIRQVNAVKHALAILKQDTLVGGMIKDSKHNLRALHYQNDFILDKFSPLYLFLRFINEKIHNYIINKHRKLRLKTNFTSKLAQIPGVGEKTITKLLTNYPSYEAIKNAPAQELGALGITARVIKLLKERL